MNPTMHMQAHNRLDFKVAKTTMKLSSLQEASSRIPNFTIWGKKITNLSSNLKCMRGHTPIDQPNSLLKRINEKSP